MVITLDGGIFEIFFVTLIIVFQPQNGSTVANRVLSLTFLKIAYEKNALIKRDIL